VADASAWAYRRTSTGHDRSDSPRSDGHRTLTHTVLAGLVAGALAGLFAALAPHGPAILVGMLVAFAGQAVLPATSVRPIER
jgi:membrane-bound metal-dependent hydrolase YbcI (DUF457 family)